MAQRQEAEDLSEEIGHLGGVLGLHFAFKPVHLVHHIGFMVATRHEEVVGVEKLEADHREDRLDRKRATIDKVSVEELQKIDGLL